MSESGVKVNVPSIDPVSQLFLDVTGLDPFQVAEDGVTLQAFGEEYILEGRVRVFVSRSQLAVALVKGADK